MARRIRVRRRDRRDHRDPGMDGRTEIAELVRRSAERVELRRRVEFAILEQTLVPAAEVAPGVPGRVFRVIKDPARQEHFTAVFLSLIEDLALQGESTAQDWHVVGLQHVLIFLAVRGFVPVRGLLEDAEGVTLY